MNVYIAEVVRTTDSEMEGFRFLVEGGTVAEAVGVAAGLVEDAGRLELEVWLVAEDSNVGAYQARYRRLFGGGSC